jgi:rRNA-processing protein FCF1
MLLRPGKSCDDAIKLLDAIAQGEMNNTRNAIPTVGSPGYAQLMQSAIVKYEAWARDTIRTLGEVFAELDLPGRIRGEKYWLIVGSDVSSPRTASLMHTEFSDLAIEFLHVAKELRQQCARYADRTGRCLVLDTNDLLHYQRFDNIPWAHLYKRDAWVVIPHVVLDEIDRKSYEAGGKVHTRARGVYKILEGLLTDSDDKGYANLSDGTPCLILVDDPGHRRESNNDEEIVSRASFLQQALHPGQVTIITRDLGMRARAKARSLKAESLPEKYLIPTDGLMAADLMANLAVLQLAAESLPLPVANPEPGLPLDTSVQEGGK